MPPDKLVRMANQIGLFFASQSRGRDQVAVESILDHLRRFWEPRMRTAIVAHLHTGGDGLDPLPRQAVGQLADLPRSPPDLTREPPFHAS